MSAPQLFSDEINCLITQLRTLDSVPQVELLSPLLSHRVYQLTAQIKLVVASFELGQSSQVAATPIAIEKSLQVQDTARVYDEEQHFVHDEHVVHTVEDQRSSEDFYFVEDQTIQKSGQIDEGFYQQSKLYQNSRTNRDLRLSYTWGSCDIDESGNGWRSVATGMSSDVSKNKYMQKFKDVKIQLRNQFGVLQGFSD